MLARKINKILFPLGIQIKKARQEEEHYPVEASPRDKEILDFVLSPDDPKKRLSMSTTEAVWAAIQSAKYIVKNNIKGDFVECGVWRGGIPLAIAMVLKDLNSDKKIFLYDTYEGMTKPSEFDIDYTGKSPEKKFTRLNKDTHNEWCFASLEDVKSHFIKTSLIDKAIFIKGDVCKTLKEKDNLPKEISLLRLNTDWYESTKVEMDILYPLLSKDGVLLLDTYGYWEGARKAIDEYLENNNLTNKSLFWKMDRDERGFIKK